MAVLALKRKEIKRLSDEGTKESPILLLDDIFSELDHTHRDDVMNLVNDYPGQVIMTTCQLPHIYRNINAKIICISPNTPFQPPF